MTDNTNVYPLGPLYASFAKAQGDYRPVKRTKSVKVRTKSGDTYTFSYAPLEEILDAVRPALSANGLSVFQRVEDGESDDYVLSTTLAHDTGAEIVTRMTFRVGEPGAQAFASRLTYARRYALTTLLVVAAEDDDDGNAGEGNQAQAVERPVKTSTKVPKTPAAPRVTQAPPIKAAPKSEPPPHVPEQPEPPADVPESLQPDQEFAAMFEHCARLWRQLGWSKSRARMFVTNVTGKNIPELDLVSLGLVLTETKEEVRNAMPADAEDIIQGASEGDA